MSELMSVAIRLLAAIDRAMAEDDDLPDGIDGTLIDDLRDALTTTTPTSETGLREVAGSLIAALYAYDRLPTDQGMRHQKADAGREVWYRRSMLEAALAPQEPEGNCPECGGLGHVDYPFVACKKCKGTGNLSAQPIEDCSHEITFTDDEKPTEPVVQIDGRTMTCRLCGGAWRPTENERHWNDCPTLKILAPVEAPLQPGTCPECRGTGTWGETSDCPDCNGSGKEAKREEKS